VGGGGTWEELEEEEEEVEGVQIRGSKMTFLRLAGVTPVTVFEKAAASQRLRGSCSNTAATGRSDPCCS